MTATSSTEPRRIFISYRRSDCQPQANGLHDGLRHRVKNSRIFMDIDSIPPGADFEEHIRQEIENCQVVLVLIGDTWLQSRAETGTRRLDEDEDFVRLEIESALNSDTVRLIPVLVEGATMPRSAELPESIRRLARLNAIELSDTRWASDIERLANLVETIPTKQSMSDTPSPDRTTNSASTPQPVMNANVPPPPIRPASVPRTPPPAVSPPQYVAPAPTGAQTGLGWFMAAVPLLTCGLGSFAPGLRSALIRRQDRKFFWRMLAFAFGAWGVGMVGFALVGSSPTDSEGSATGALSNVGVVLYLVSIVATVAGGIVFRNPRQALAGTSVELARRQQRDSYRQLAQRDPALALRIGVGRPRLVRDFEDGGLVDLNAATSADLEEFIGLTRQEATQLIEVRERLGRFSGVTDVQAFVDLRPTAEANLKELAIVL